ncbi:twin-arginine translocation pathway signal prote in [Desulfonema ishimotonii]|uniref:Twin-arginine translocation pathway signal prote in n=1 Tax=Desulfonema ishimotonii TaxID=45657 RepID=A0A401FTK7_9BACT|nr:ABC transporter substrate-binding protein [Desulfonema ishimotonii]GBC60296.1 twin-arginine translocation pathway signal prote in [Desulfonema ishimotonii]
MKRPEECTGINRREFMKKTVAGCAALGTGIIGFPAIVRARTRLSVGYLPILDHMILPVSHANDREQFRKADITPRMLKSWSSVSGALKAGKLDGAFLLSPYAMHLFEKGAGIKSVLVGHRNGSGITVKKGSEISGPGDLKGKKIAIPAHISTHTALLDRYLREAGLSLADVVLRSVAPSDMISALQRGRIDAFIVAEPFCAKAETMGIGQTLVLSKQVIPGHICCCVVVRDDILRSDPEGIRELVASLQKSGRFIDEDKGANSARNVARIATDYMPHKTGDIISGMLNPSDRITYSNLFPVKADFRQILEISKKAGIVGDLNLDTFIDDRFAKRES